MDIEPTNATSLFDRLRNILNRYEIWFKVKEDQPGSYILNTAPTSRHPDVITFGGVETKDGGVLYHLTPVEMFETISNPLSPQIKEHMRGPSTFYFDSLEQEDLFQELEALTQLSVDKMKIEGMV